MRRRLAEATKARRTRRTRGEMVLRFFLVVLERVLVEAAGFFLAGVFVDAVFFAGAR
jgi:hypothetical protein